MAVACSRALGCPLVHAGPPARHRCKPGWPGPAGDGHERSRTTDARWGCPVLLPAERERRADPGERQDARLGGEGRRRVAQADAKRSHRRRHACLETAAQADDQRHDENADRNRALRDVGALADWLAAGLTRTAPKGTFTIILRADSFSAKYGWQDLKHGNVMGTAQAVAQIWRDPLPLPNSNRHRCFVRLFKILPP